MIEKLAYGIPVSAPLWIVMFEATEDEDNALVQKNELTKVFLRSKAPWKHGVFSFYADISLAYMEPIKF